MAPGLSGLPRGNMGQGYGVGASLFDFRVVAENFMERFLNELSDAADGDDVESGSRVHVRQGVMEIEII